MHIYIQTYVDYIKTFRIKSHKGAYYIGQWRSQNSNTEVMSFAIPGIPYSPWSTSGAMIHEHHRM